MLKNKLEAGHRTEKCLVQPAEAATVMILFIACHTLLID